MKTRLGNPSAQDFPLETTCAELYRSCSGSHCQCRNASSIDSYNNVFATARVARRNRDDNQSPAERSGSGALGRMTAISNWSRNRLLLALPSSDLQQLMPELEQIRCEREQVLMDADSSLDHIFFPDSGVVSAVAVYADGSIIEMATIGREGCTAVQAVLGAEASSIRLLVQLAPRGRGKDAPPSLHSGYGVDAVLPKSHVRLRPSLSRASPGVSSVQRGAQPQAAASALAAHDA